MKFKTSEKLIQFYKCNFHSKHLGQFLMFLLTKLLKQITIYFARWLVIRVPRDPVKFSCSLLFDFFYKHLTHRRSTYNDNTVTDDFEICQKFFLKQFLWVLTFNIYQLLSITNIKTVVFIGFKKVSWWVFIFKQKIFSWGNSWKCLACKWEQDERLRM